MSKPLSRPNGDDMIDFGTVLPGGLSESKGIEMPLFGGNKQFYPEVFGPEELSTELLEEIADDFRYMFNNAWPDYAVCIDCDQNNSQGMRISALEAYPGSEQDENGYIPLSVMDEFPRTPVCPCCNQPMQILNDRQKMRTNITTKLSSGGYVSLFRYTDNDRLAGFAFGYFGLKKGFEYEWHNPYLYMATDQPDYERNFDQFKTKLGDGLGINLPDDSFFVLNSVALDRRLRGGKGVFLSLFINLLNRIPNKGDVKIISEVMREGGAMNLFRKGGGVAIEGCLGQGHTILVTDLREGLRIATDMLRQKIEALFNLDVK